MPIYAYRCEACGFAKDVLQKISDPRLTVCLSCGEPAFKKQLTAAGFQLKGTGWYATDFRNGSGTAAPAVVDNPGEAGADAKTGTEKAGVENSGGADKAAGSSADKNAGDITGKSTGKSTGSAEKTASTAVSTAKPAAPATGTGSTG